MDDKPPPPAPMAPPPPPARPAPPPPPLDSLLETLRLLIAQARAYELILPPDNPARAALAVLGDQVRKAMNEAESLAEALQPRPTAACPLSPRELQVLALAARGLTNKEIAYRLAISERTVQFHMNAIFNKTNTCTRTEAVALAIHNRWLPDEIHESLC